MPCIFFGCIICKTKLPGGVSLLREAIEPKIEAVVRWLLTVNYNGELCWSRVSLSISCDFSAVSSSVFLKAVIVSFSCKRLGTLWSEGWCDFSHWNWGSNRRDTHSCSPLTSCNKSGSLDRAKFLNDSGRGSKSSTALIFLLMGLHSQMKHQIHVSCFLCASWATWLWCTWNSFFIFIITSSSGISFSRFEWYIESRKGTKKCWYMSTACWLPILENVNA